jgi:hypothetical protein
LIKTGKGIYRRRAVCPFRTLVGGSNGGVASVVAGVAQVQRLAFAKPDPGRRFVDQH